jgi:hypothetical protein
MTFAYGSQESTEAESHDGDGWDSWREVLAVSAVILHYGISICMPVM